MDSVDQLAFAVVLRETYLGADFTRDGTQRLLDVGKRLPAIQLGFTRAKKIQVRAIDDGNPHVFFNPLSHALNCAMSSGLSTGGAPISADGLAGVTFVSPEKN